MKNRYEARQEAVKILFSREFHSAGDIQYAEREILDQDVVSTEEGDIILENDLTAYCDYLVDTTTEHCDEIDSIIQSFSKDWDIHHMNRTDKTIMRIALCELLYPKEGEMAPSIVINEAVELAKEFSGQKSARFVNGILGAYVRTKE